VVASLINCLIWIFLGLLFGSRIEEAIRFARQSEAILLGIALALVLYFVVEQILIKRHVVSKRSFWIRQATGTKIAAVVATVLLAVLVGRFLFPNGVAHGLRFQR
jgi:hypothetical protein